MIGYWLVIRLITNLSHSSVIYFVMQRNLNVNLGTYCWRLRFVDLKNNHRSQASFIWHY